MADSEQAQQGAARQHGVPGGEEVQAVVQGQAVALQVMMEQMAGVQNQLQALQQVQDHQPVEQQQQQQYEAQAQHQVAQAQQKAQQQVQQQQQAQPHQGVAAQQIVQGGVGEAVQQGDSGGVGHGPGAELAAAVQQQQQQLAIILPMSDALGQQVGQLANLANPNAGPRGDLLASPLEVGGADAAAPVHPPPAEKSTGEKEAEKREAKEWVSKDGVRMWFAAALIRPSVQSSRLQEQVNDDLVLSDAVYKIIMTMSTIKIKLCAAIQVDVGGGKSRDSSTILVSERFAAFTRGLEAVVELNGTAIGGGARGGIVGTVPHDDDLHHYVYKFRNAFVGDCAMTTTAELENAIDQDLAVFAFGAAVAADHT